jgi:hypothetical protein
MSTDIFSSHTWIRTDVLVVIKFGVNGRVGPADIEPITSKSTHIIRMQVVASRPQIKVRVSITVSSSCDIMAFFSFMSNCYFAPWNSSFRNYKMEHLIFLSIILECDIVPIT